MNDPGSPPARPNVLFIAVDDLNHWVRHLGRNPQAITPNIDRLARQGVTFTRAYCAAPVCNPSRAALLSGLRPSTTGVYDNGTDWRPRIAEELTLPSLFRRSGYRVVGGGKIYHGGFERRSEWDDDHKGEAASREAGGARTNRKAVGGIRWAEIEGGDDSLPDFHVVSQCIEELERPHAQPFFIACGIFRPHLPWEVPRRYYDLYPIDSIQLPPHREDDLDDLPPAGVRMARPQGDHAAMLKAGLWREAIRAYLASVTFADAQVGRLLDALEKSPHRDDTIVVLWGDHGWHLGEKRHWRKFTLWEEAARAPLLWVVPGVTKAGGVCERTVDFLGICPTLAELCGLETPKHVEGVSFKALLADPAAAWDRPALTTHGYRNHAVRSERWRYIRCSGGGEELYDEASDPYEWTNLARRPELGGVIAELARSLPATDADPRSPPRLPPADAGSRTQPNPPGADAVGPRTPRASRATEPDPRAPPKPPAEEDGPRSVATSPAPASTGARLARVGHEDPALVVDLGVGLYGYPLPIDWDGDGDLDLLVSCPDRPYNGTYLFEHPGPPGEKDPVLGAPRRLGRGVRQATLSWVGGKPRLLESNFELPRFREGDFDTTAPLYPKDRVAPIGKLRGNAWRLVDLDGDGASDLLVGHGSWDDFGGFDTNDWWKRYDASGRWMGALLRGTVHWLRNVGSDAEPAWGEPARLEAAGNAVIETNGWPTPNLADFDGDGDLDLICGEFLDQLTWFENDGTRTAPRFLPGRRLERDGAPIALELQLIFPAAVDWDGDGDVDLLVGDEDGRVAFLENTGRVEGHVEGRVQGRMPVFEAPRYLRQRADAVKFGALVTPVGCDWDSDGDIDLICGNTAGFLAFIENLGGPGVERPRLAAPRRLEAGGRILRVQAGPSGSIQGPIEAKWGYTTQTVADWDGDGLLDIVASSIWGRVFWCRNEGAAGAPRLAAPAPVTVEWSGAPPKPAWNWWNPEGNELVTQWRTTPVAVDWNGDGLVDLVMLDVEGYLALFERALRDGRRVLLPPRRAFADPQGALLRLNAGEGGRSGRRKLCVVDWDGDGKEDLLVNSSNANLLRQVGAQDGVWRFEDLGPLAADNIEAHDVSPTTVDWNGDGVPDFLGGGEDGHLYYLRNPRAAAR